MVQHKLVWAAIAFSLLALSGCGGGGSGGTGTPGAASPEVTQLSASPSQLAPGAATTLSWASSNATGCRAEGNLPGWSGAKSTTGNQVLRPSPAGTYEARLVCSDVQSRSDSASITITVSSAAVDVLTFSATPSNLLAGGSTTLSWTSSNAQSCSGSGTLPGWAGSGKAVNGSQTLSGLTVGNYTATLSCIDDQSRSDSQTLTVSVTSTPPAITIDTFSADPSELDIGSSTTLTWTSTGAASCSAQGSLPGWTGTQLADSSKTLTLDAPGAYTATLVCGTASRTLDVTVLPMDRYAMANGCYALKSASTGKYLAHSEGAYSASATTLAGAEGFHLKPAALGEYLLYNQARNLMAAGLTLSNPMGALCPLGQALCDQALAQASDAAIFVVKAAGDATNYPPSPQFDVEPTPASIGAYRAFVDPRVRAERFTLSSKTDGRRLNAGVSDTLTLAMASAALSQQFLFEPHTCAAFPEAQNNAEGETFKGTTDDGRVLGMADTHVHVAATTFLANAKSGAPFHKFGVTHAVGDCAAVHGPLGAKDAVGAALGGDVDGHQTAGWPTFTDWPAAGALTHESIYWKWMERAWLGGLRLIVNDVVENGTLCELQRNATGDLGRNCNEMQSARNQIGTLYAMQDYIDAQYGGRGKGWWRVVLSPAEARTVIAQGKLAVVIGIEISNLFNCQLNYRPLRTQEPFEETGEGGLENAYACATTETGAPNEIKTQLDQMWALGARQIITIHEFDNAFGGNGIFDGLVLNLGNRENSGGNPLPGIPPDDPFAFNPLNEIPTGEFWTTYDCPSETQLAEAPTVDGLLNGYLWGDSGGAIMTNVGLSPPLCPYTGQGGRHGGTTACYPAALPQCNARWMTPTGLYTYKKLMERGMIFDIDHLTIDMKTQALELAEAQTPAYPFVSTHGTFGGTTLEQTRRILKNGGHLYPSLGNGPSLLADMAEVRAQWAAAGEPALFGFGFGTDTNGLSAQAGPRNNTQITRAGAITYPFKLFDVGPSSIYGLVPGLDNDSNPATPYTGVTFKQPEEFDLDGSSARTWHIDQDGSAHYGMLSEMVEEVRREIVADANGQPLTTQNTQPLRDLLNAAEVYLQTWEKTLASSAAIGGVDGTGQARGDAAEILRAAPVSP